MKTFIQNLLLIIISFLTIFFSLKRTWAIDASLEYIPPRYGLSLVLGNTYDPTNNIDFIKISGFALYDYDQVWHNSAPDELRFKVECSLGATTGSRNHIMLFGGMLALYYLNNFNTKWLKPYVEAGIGIIYTDFQVEGQGLRINFNPQIGIGTEFLGDLSHPFFVSVRLHHISNGELHKDNRGINSIVLILGRFF